MNLRDILRNIDYSKMTGNPDIEIKGLTSNSNEVKENYMFCAVRGDITDGHSYIDHALNNGANSVLLEHLPRKISDDVTYIQVGNTRSITPRIASNYYDNPSLKLRLIGITGTNGKTTISYLIDSILRKNNLNSGIIGTIEISYNGKTISANMTTPDSIELTSILHDMVEKGVDAVAMEVSSHALDRNRVDGCHFDGAIFTNLTQDHLDYHRTMDNYFNSKKKLFTEILAESDKAGKIAVINIDDNFGKELSEELPYKTITYSLKSRAADIYTENFNISLNGIEAEVSTKLGIVNIKSNLIGEHNLYNIIASVGMALELDMPVEIIEKALSGNIRVPGRLERVENSHGIEVFVDYAHTPDALENVLEALIPLKNARIITVFGCGGDRDRGKRPIMGEIASRLSEKVFITSDNPRTENPEFILDEIEQGILNSGSPKYSYTRIKGREDAIKAALAEASQGDIVLIAGKGHEDYQILGNEKFDFDDRLVAKNFLENERLIQ